MANIKPVIKDSTINKIRTLINNDGGDQLELVDLIKHPAYLSIHRNHMNQFERLHSTKIVSHVYDNMDNEAIKYLIMEGDNIMGTKNNASGTKGTQTKRSQEFAAEIDQSTDEKIFMVTNLTNVSVEEGIDVSIGEERVGKTETHTGPAFPEEFEQPVNDQDTDEILFVTEGRIVNTNGQNETIHHSDKKNKTGELGYNACMSHFGSMMDRVAAAQKEARKKLEEKKSA